MDPHSGSHDMIIRNNTVHENGKMGIICSGNCRSIIIEANNVYNNVGSGIAFSIDMQYSIVRNNTIFNQTNTEDVEDDIKYNGISISESSNNMVYDNKISDSDIGIYIRKDSSDNHIYDNVISEIKSYATQVESLDSLDNVFVGNYIDNSEHIVK